MQGRSKHDETCHNRSVAKRAAGLKANRWKVKAAVPSYPNPPKMNGRIPDIVATKGKKTKIIEVETESTKKAHKQQRIDLRDYANRHKNTEFYMRTCKT